MLPMATRRSHHIGHVGWLFWDKSICKSIHRLRMLISEGIWCVFSDISHKDEPYRSKMRTQMFFKFTHALETHSLHQKQKRCLPKTKSRDKRLKILSLLFVLQGRLSQVMSLVKLSLETLLKSKTRVRQKTRDINSEPNLNWWNKIAVGVKKSSL